MAAAEAEEDDARIFKQAVDGLVLDSENSSCIKGDLGESQVGGDGTSVDINNIIILIILFHGIINLTEEQIRQQMAPPTINTDSLPTITNLAYLGVAPTGLPNIGLLQELDIIKKIVEHDMMELITSSIESSLQSSLQSIEDKANEIIKSRLAEIRSPRKVDTSGIVSRICNVCFKVGSIVGSIVNDRFKGILSVCKNILPGSILPSSGGANKRNVAHGNYASDTRRQIKNSFSMSRHMCLLLFDDLRKYMQLIDRGRFPMICGDIKSVTGKAALANCGARCRKLHLVKGFDDPDELPTPPPLPEFINKHLAYTHKDDRLANMGVRKLRFRIDDSGDVICKSEKFEPLKLMTAIETDRTGNLIWSNVEACIRYCSLHDPNGRPVSNPNNTTICAIDLSCSGFVGGNPELRDLGPTIAHPGGGKGNKKNPKSTKKARRKSRTKRIRNKSTNIKHMRNMRNRRKCKNNTKKLKKSRRQ
jgi:hypothetical protein